MIDELQVKDIALIEDADIVFSPHLTVLTGETGAGKTALLSALKLITGKRADSKIVRDNCAESRATARFIDNQGEEYILSRRLNASGRSRCSIDGEMATVAQLSTATAHIHVHSQSEQVQLLQSSKQRAYLDYWISQDLQHVKPYQDARERFLEKQKEYISLKQASESQTNELEFLRFTLQEIEKVNPLEEEYEQLEAELPRMQHAQQLASCVDEALNVLYADNSTLDYLAQSIQSLQRVSGVDLKLDEIASRLEELESELNDTARDLSAWRETIISDPETLQNTLERLDALSGLMKRFGPDMQSVFKTWEHAKKTIDAAQSSPEHLDCAFQEMESAKKIYQDEALKLADIRHQGALHFCQDLQKSLEGLAMKDALFEFEFKPLEFNQWTDTGSEYIELMYKPAKNMKFRPLSRIASGGEMSRILLALECLHQGEHETYIFDEVDQGIGGQTGAIVAQRLYELSRHAQVIVVSHLAQVAARADSHYLVVKSKDENDFPVTEVKAISGEERVYEIARMLAGTVDDTACAHARGLLAQEDK